MILKAFFSKFFLKNQAIILSSESSANLIEITDKVKIVKNSFKQIIKKNDDIKAAHFFTLTFKYKFSACNQFFKMSVLLNNYSKSVKRNVENE